MSQVDAEAAKARVLRARAKFDLRIAAAMERILAWSGLDDSLAESVRDQLRTAIYAKCGLEVSKWGDVKFARSGEARLLEDKCTEAAGKLLSDILDAARKSIQLTEAEKARLLKAYRKEVLAEMQSKLRQRASAEAAKLLSEWRLAYLMVDELNKDPRV